VTITTARGEETITTTGTGTATTGGVTYAVTLTDVLVTLGDGAPSGGSVTLVWTNAANREMTLVVTSSEATVADGTVGVTLNGFDLGAMSPSEIKAIIEGDAQ